MGVNEEMENRHKKEKENGNENENESESESEDDIGCTAIMERQHLNQHLLTECKFTVLKCSNSGCNFHSYRKDIQFHIETCPFRIVHCNLCNEPVQFNSLNVKQKIKNQKSKTNKQTNKQNKTNNNINLPAGFQAERIILLSFGFVLMV